MRASMRIALAVTVFGLAAWATVPAVGQDKPAERSALDQRLKPLPGKGLERVALTTDLDGGRPKVSFKLKNGNTYALELVKDDWLSGKLILTGGTRGSSSSPDRPVELERKK